MKDDEYFVITWEYIPKLEKIFPYALYLRESEIEKYDLILPPNLPLSPEKKDFIDNEILKGKKLAVKMSQKETFLNHVDLKEEDITSLEKEFIHPMEEKRNQRIKIMEEKDQWAGVKKRDHRTLLLNCFYNNDFTKIMDQVRDELLIFDVTHSSTMSLAVEFCEKTFLVDNTVNRISCISHVLAQIAELKSEEDLSTLFVASRLHHLGFTQLDSYYTTKAYNELTEKQMSDYRTHPKLSYHLMKKSKIDVSERCIKIVLDHHELEDGSGYPQGKMLNQIDFLSIVLGTASYLVEYAEGYITGEKIPYESLIDLIKESGIGPNPKFNFGPGVYGILKQLINV